MAPAPAPEPVSLFYSYSHEDEKYRQRLEKWLKMLQREGLIQPWHDGMIDAGSDWHQQISSNLDIADLILCLVSADFIASDFCFEKEMKAALARKSARVVPIILRPCQWSNSPLRDLQALPKDGKPISKWDDEDDAFENVIEGIRRVIQSLRLEPTATGSATEPTASSQVERTRKASPPDRGQPAVQPARGRFPAHVVREIKGDIDPKTFFKRERKPLPPVDLIPLPKNVEAKYLEGPFLPKVANRCGAVAGQVGFQSSTYLPFFSNGYETQVFEPDIVNEVVDLSDNDHVLVNYSADVVRVLNTAPPGGDFPPYAGNGKFVYRFKAFLAVNGPGDKYLLRAQKRKLPEDSVVSEDVVVLVSFSSK